MAQPPGNIRDSIVAYLQAVGADASLKEIERAVTAQIGDVSPSSVRSYLNLNVGEFFERTARGRYRLRVGASSEYQLHGNRQTIRPVLRYQRATLYEGDCFEWLASQEPSSIHACVTDPPYGLVEYSALEQIKLRNGKGGIWRIPPSFDGHRRSPLPRFTVLDRDDRTALFGFFRHFGILLSRVLPPGGNAIVASNPLLSHIVAAAMSEAGLEVRGTIIRLVMTMRGGDRPKNAHYEFGGVSVIPRSMFEPWIVFRKGLEGRVQDNLRKHRAGGFRRPSDDKPFGDVIASHRTPRKEKKIAPHPSLKPQSFLRKIVRASLPLGEGVVLDPFAGSGSTLAAANAVGYSSIGVENDPEYVTLAMTAVKELGELELIDPV